MRRCHSVESPVHNDRFYATKRFLPHPRFCQGLQQDLTLVVDILTNYGLTMSSENTNNGDESMILSEYIVKISDEPMFFLNGKDTTSKTQIFV